MCNIYQYLSLSSYAAYFLWKCQSFYFPRRWRHTTDKTLFNILLSVQRIQVLGGIAKYRSSSRRLFLLFIIIIIIFTTTLLPQMIYYRLSNRFVLVVYYSLFIPLTCKLSVKLQYMFTIIWFYRAQVNLKKIVRLLSGCGTNLK